MQQEQELKRSIGVFGLACAIINLTIGTGIFVLPALVAEKMGTAAILAYLICGLLIFCIALCFAEVGTKVTSSGGTYAYIEAAFGPFAGFIANNLFWLGSCVIADAAVANALSQTIGYFLPVVDSAAVRPVFFLLLFGSLAYMNIRGVKSGLRFIIFTTFAKLVPLILLSLYGLTQLTGKNLQWQTFSLNDLGSATFILFFAFLGIESVVTNSGEFKNPRKVIPAGIFTGLLIVLVIYVSIQLVAQGVLGAGLVDYKDAPLSEVSKRLIGIVGITLITIATAVSMLGGLSGEVMAIPRVLFAGARDGILPAALGKIHSRFVTPHIAIIVYAALGYLFAVFGAFKQLVIMTTAATLLIYLGVVLSTIKLRYKKLPVEEESFKIPGGLLIPIIAIIIIVWILTHLTKEELLSIAAALLLLVTIYLFMRWYKNRPALKTGEVVNVTSLK